MLRPNSIAITADGSIEAAPVEIARNPPVHLIFLLGEERAALKAGVRESVFPNFNSWA
jgi:hypothetical protein